MFLFTLFSFLFILDCYSMAFSKQVTASLFVVLALAYTDPSACQQVVKGKVTCLDCPQHHDLTGIKVVVKCDEVKKVAMASTDEEGVFQVDLPQDTSSSSSPNKCGAKISGGPYQIYSSNKKVISELVKTPASNSYTISTPLAFSLTCAKCGDDKNMFDSSKTVDLPVPPEWGLAPTSYYVPFLPIIGIP